MYRLVFVSLISIDKNIVSYSGEASVIFMRGPNTNNFFKQRKLNFFLKFYTLNLRVKYV